MPNNELIEQVKQHMNDHWQKNIQWIKSKIGESGLHSAITRELKPELEDKPLEVISAKIMYEIIKNSTRQ